jgi:hypothetical protein
LLLTRINAGDVFRKWKSGDIMKKKAYSGHRSKLASVVAFVVLGLTIVSSTLASIGGEKHEVMRKAGDILLTSGGNSIESLAANFNPGEVLTEVGQNVLADRLEKLFSKFPHRILPAERERLAKMLVEEGGRAGIDPLFLAAVIRVESAFYTGAVSNKGAMGLMQVMPETGREVAGLIGMEWTGPEQLHDLEINVRLGVFYLDQLLEMYKGNYRLALTAYNRGPANVRFIVRRHGKLEPRFTEYFRKIQHTYRAYLRSIDGLGSVFHDIS